MHNLVYFVHDKQLPIRTIIARVVMSELLTFGYDYLTPEAKHAVVGLITDEQGRIITVMFGRRVQDPAPVRRPQTPASGVDE
jgi:hypothetical protein